MFDHLIVSIVALFLYYKISKFNYTKEQAVMFVLIVNIAYHIFFMNQVRAFYREKFEAGITGNTIPPVKQEQIASLEKELVRLRQESAQQHAVALQQTSSSVLMNNSQAFITPPSKPPSDSCDCEAKVERILDDYMKKKDMTDNRYNELRPEQMEPMGSYDATFTNRFDHGFTYLNTSKWAPPQRNTPVCKTESRCPVCPVSTSGYPVDVLQYDSSRKVMPPDNINVNYVKDQLNKSV